MSDTPAIDDGSTIAQLFYGADALVCDVVNTLSDNIHTCGTMTTLITDGGKYEVLKKATDILHTFFISQ